MAEEINKEREEQIQSELEVLRNSYEMYEKSIAEMKDKRSTMTDKNGNRVYDDKSIKTTQSLMETMQKDIKTKYISLGGNEEDLKKRTNKKKIDRRAMLEKINAENAKEQMRAYIEKMNGENAESKEVKIERSNRDKYEEVLVSQLSKEKIEETKPEPTPSIEIPNNFVEEKPTPKNYNVTGNKVTYDTVKLPSGGQCYPHKKKEIMVSELVAYDENLILSPNLYSNGTFLDHILKNKVIDDINPEDLIQGDRDAIIIWLRANGYGNEYPIRVTDDSTGKSFETIVDLSKLEYKKFDLVGDENGYFTYKLPNTGDIIKFKFLTNRDIKELDEMRKKEEKEIHITEIKRNIRTLRSFLRDEENFSTKDSDTLNENLDKIEDAVFEKYDKIPETYYIHNLTNMLLLSTISINGITDRKYIVNYILNMKIADCDAYRQYIVDNEPGVDFNIKVKRPDSLGGGYIDTFLQLNQFIFVN